MHDQKRWVAWCPMNIDGVISHPQGRWLNLDFLVCLITQAITTMNGWQQKCV
jgi:hypothetical protein